jgi:anionic cell wall polymer biosynthesis LytR-Cps2A-Psr (LCP) family protein
VKKTFDYKADISIFLILAIVLLLAGGTLYTLNVLHSDPIEEALAGENILNILFILEHEEKPLGTYIMMYSPRNQRAAAISVPGETGRILKTLGKVDRLDSVYYSNNINAYKTELEELLGISIAYSIVFETAKLAKIIDVIGGVDIFIPNAIEIYGEEIILFPSGNTALDGDKGIQYIVFEFPEEDPNEAGLRRERFFLGLLKNLGEKNILFKDPSIARYFYPLLKTRMNRFTQKRLFQSLAALNMDRINMQALAGNYREVSGHRLLMPYYDGTVIRDVVQQAQWSLAQQTQGTLMERIFTVEILNGTTTTGLASRTAELIRSFNYEVIATDNADRNDYQETEIIDRTEVENAAHSFASVIRCKNIKYESRTPADTDPGIQNTEYRADFTLIIGSDFNGRIVTGN